ncbi:unnamed protein product [Adineta steineri]|uniref:Uncharacterized protein n=2 Tax=Adineta steineri TaxID=433720 RepID=A0A818G3V2_9BILA|nr:unnamed protein product [Adineta steineri]CAF0754716.1 unnamed protein product [Adineta steineri]CAF3483689.1 unnamed protein product [Adineta steineri]CAF3920003.1 unnamed protein product [Adineta steineri]
MVILVIEITVCAILAIALIGALLFCNKVYSRESDNNGDTKKIDFTTTSMNEELLVQNALMTYYEQQRNELIERQKVALEDSTLNMTVLKTNDSGFVSMASPSQTPHSLYEYSGFACMDDTEVPNPLFSPDILYDCERMSVTSSSAIK